MVRRAKPKPPGKKPLPDYQPLLDKRSKYMSNPDRKDYQRTIAGRGDTHALDGGKIPLSITQRGKSFKKAIKDKHKQPLLQQQRQPLLPVWEDRDVSKRGSKLGG
jgi:hypothetical protein